MATRDEMNGLEAGATLAALPLDSMIATLGVGIAKAQDALDTHAIETAVKLAELKLEFPGPLDANAADARRRHGGGNQLWSRSCCRSDRPHLPPS